MRRPRASRDGGRPGRHRPAGPRRRADARQVRLAHGPGGPARPARRRDLRPLPLPDGGGGGPRRADGGHPLRAHGPRPGRPQPRPAHGAPRHGRSAAAGVLGDRREPLPGRGPARVRPRAAPRPRGRHGGRPGALPPRGPRGRQGAPAPRAGRTPGAGRGRAHRPQEPPRPASGLRPRAGGATRRPPRLRRRRAARPRGGRGSAPARAREVGHPHGRPAPRASGRLGDGLRRAGPREPGRAARRRRARGAGRRAARGATRVGGTREVVPDPGAGRIVDPADPSEIARAILAVLDSPPSPEACRRAAEPHGIDRQAARVAAILRAAV